HPGEGPLGGILTALSHTQSDWNLILACDMPAIEAPLLKRLLAAARESGPRALVPVTPEVRPGEAGGRLQPLCAVYHSTCLAPFRAAFSSGVRAIHRALAGIDWVRLPMEDLSQF